MTFTHALATNNYGPAKFIVSSSAANGTHTTIAAALTSASSGDTIFIRPGTYTENLTLKAGVNIVAFAEDSITPNVTIIGKATFTAAGTVTFGNIRFQTNSDFFLAVTGSAASIVLMNKCYFNCTNNTGISFTTSSSSALIRANNCKGDLGTTGIAWYSMSSAGILVFDNCVFTNSGSSTTQSSNSAGQVNINYTEFSANFATSSTGNLLCFYSKFASGGANQTVFTYAGTNSANALGYCQVNSGSASAISIGTGCACSIGFCTITSSNTNAITGAGSLSSAGNIYVTSAVVNTTTQTSLNSGTFTPGIAFGGGTTGITYSTQAGEWSLFNNVVYFNIIVALSNKGSSTGAATITGLPFVVGGSAVIGQIPIANNVTFTAGNTNAYFQSAATTTTLNLAQWGATVNNASLTNTNFANNTNLQFQGFYFLN